jgi:hypothetical protein
MKFGVALGRKGKGEGARYGYTVLTSLGFNPRRVWGPDTRLRAISRKAAKDKSKQTYEETVLQLEQPLHRMSHTKAKLPDLEILWVRHRFPGFVRYEAVRFHMDL